MRLRMRIAIRGGSKRLMAVKCKFGLAVLGLVMVLVGGTPAQAQSSSVQLTLPGSGTQLLIGGGLPFGLYFPLAGTLCRLVETGASPRACAVASLPDSAAAILTLQDGRMPFALVQSDWLYHAVQGTSRYREVGPALELRSVAAFYTEAITIFVKATGPVKSLKDLAGKRVSVGAANSYRGILADAALGVADLSRDDLAEASAEPVAAAIERLCDGRSDAVVLMAVHPAESLLEAGRRCGVTPMSFSDAEVAEMLSSLLGYAEVIIPAKTYAGQAVPVKTIGLRPVLVTTADADPALVASLTSTIARGLARLNSAHPAFSAIRIDDLVAASQFAPLHPAAAQALGVSGQ